MWTGLLLRRAHAMACPRVATMFGVSALNYGSQICSSQRPHIQKTQSRRKVIAESWLITRLACQQAIDAARVKRSHGTALPNAYAGAETSHSLSLLFSLLACLTRAGFRMKVSYATLGELMP